MPTLSVGRLYHPSRTRWPEAAQYQFRRGGHELVLFLDSPSHAEVEAARTGTVDLAVYVAPPAIVALYRLGGDRGIPWSDAPYSWHLVPADERDLPSADLEQAVRALLSVVLVDAATGIVRAIRAVSMSPELTRALHAAIREQAAAPWDHAAYDRAIAAIYARYPSSPTLAAAAQVRCVGGA